MKAEFEIGIESKTILKINTAGQIFSFEQLSPALQDKVLRSMESCFKKCLAQFRIEHQYTEGKSGLSQKELIRFLLKQKSDILKEFVSDMVYYAHKAECQDTLSEEDFVIEKLKRRIADDEND